MSVALSNVKTIFKEDESRLYFCLLDMFDLFFTYEISGYSREKLIDEMNDKFGKIREFEIYAGRGIGWAYRKFITQEQVDFLIEKVKERNRQLER